MPRIFDNIKQALLVDATFTGTDDPASYRFQPVLRQELRRRIDATAPAPSGYAAYGPEPGKRRGYCGHPEIELALMRLYHASGEQRYLDLARYFVDERGAAPHYFDQEAIERGEDPTLWPHPHQYSQSHQLVREHHEVVGHAVLFGGGTTAAHVP